MLSFLFQSIESVSPTVLAHCALVGRRLVSLVPRLLLSGQDEEGGLSQGGKLQIEHEVVNYGWTLSGAWGAEGTPEELSAAEERLVLGQHCRLLLILGKWNFLSPLSLKAVAQHPVFKEIISFYFLTQFPWLSWGLTEGAEVWIK